MVFLVAKDKFKDMDSRVFIPTPSKHLKSTQLSHWSKLNLIITGCFPIIVQTSRAC